MEQVVTVIGGGLAGVEAALAAARSGVKVRLFEMRPADTTAAHQGDRLAELVCSNSLKSMDPLGAPWLLKRELARLGSACLEAAFTSRVPSGLSLSVDRERFAQDLTDRVKRARGVEVVRERVDRLPGEGVCVVATGPLTAPALAADLAARLGQQHLYFYDAIAPIVADESLDKSRLFAASRWGKGEADFLNAPLDKAQYLRFYEALVAAPRHAPHDFEKGRFFEGCLPLEEQAGRGVDTLRFGPMKPVGLRLPDGSQPYACAQLRRENAAGTLWNLVGFQTRLAWGAQPGVLRLIPGLERAEFVRLGSVHRNTFVNAPAQLDPGYAWKADPRVFFAGQITGVEGYLESAASGLLAGLNAARRLRGLPPLVPPRNSMLGALVHYQKASDPRHFQPMNAAWGLVEPLEARGGREARFALYRGRGILEFEAWALSQGLELFPAGFLEPAAA